VDRIERQREVDSACVYDLLPFSTIAQAAQRGCKMDNFERASTRAPPPRHTGCNTTPIGTQTGARLPTERRMSMGEETGLST
jgi:hypothetical protein